MKGTIFNIQRFCTSDGPGIRTTVFFKGCPLQCLWCHNPESQCKAQELAYDMDKCMHCLKCVSLCPQHCHSINQSKHAFERTNCIACGKCVSAHCENLEVFGNDVSVDEIILEVLKDKKFMREDPKTEHVVHPDGHL